MEDTLQVLVREHRVIEDLIRELSSTKEQCPVDTNLLFKLEAAVLDHIAKEDSRIYIPLKRIVKLSEEAVKFLDVSRDKLEDIKIQALIFFEKYKGSLTQEFCSEFRQDFFRLKKRMDERIRFEDSELFPFLKNLWSKL